MSRAGTPCLTLTIGQLAKRWGVSAARIRQLVEAGQLPGAFQIPSAGRYGAVTKIPLAIVMEVETEGWVLVPGDGCPVQFGIGLPALTRAARS